MNGKPYLNFTHTIQRQILIGVMVIAVLTAGCTEKTDKTYRVGVVCGADFFIPVINGFKTKMAELGFIEGENIFYTVQTCNDDPDAEHRAAEQFVTDRVDLILTVPTQPTIKAQEAIEGTNVPVVFAYVGIEGTSLVNSVSNPGGNITGVRFPGPEQMSKALELLLEFLPQAKRIWIGYDKDYPTADPTLNALRPLALAKGVTLIEVPVTSEKGLESDLAERDAVAEPGMDAIIIMPDTLNHSPAGWSVIRSFAEKNKIPIGGTFLNIVEQGALFGSTNDLFQESGTHECRTFQISAKSVLHTGDRVCRHERGHTSDIGLLWNSFSLPEPAGRHCR